MNDFVVTIDDKKLSVIQKNNDNVLVDDKIYNAVITKLSHHTYKLKLDNKIFHVTANKISNGKYAFLIDGHYFETSVKTRLEEEITRMLNNAAATNGASDVRSPMPGLILDVYKKNGDKVQIGDPIFLLEAMKMENEIKSNSEGVITDLSIKKGDSVEKNQLLMCIKQSNNI